MSVRVFFSQVNGGVSMCSYCGVLASFFFLQAAILAFQFTLNAPALRHKVPVRQGVITKTVRAVVGGSGAFNAVGFDLRCSFSSETR